MRQKGTHVIVGSTKKYESEHLIHTSQLHHSIFTLYYIWQSEFNDYNYKNLPSHRIQVRMAATWEYEQ